MRDSICSTLRYIEHNQGRCPVNLYTDQGNEFYNKHMKRSLDEYTDHYLPKESPKPPFQLRAEGTHLQFYDGPQHPKVLRRFTRTSGQIQPTHHDGPQHPKVLRRFTRTSGQIQPTHTFKHSNGARRREQLQCRGGLGKVVQTYGPVEPLQISIGGFHQNHQVAEEGEETRRVRFQECQGGVDTS